MNKAFVDAFLSSKVSRHARSKGKSSTDSPETYLKRVHVHTRLRIISKKRAEEAGRRSKYGHNIEDHIKALLSGYESDGSWRMSTTLVRNLLGPRAVDAMPICPLPAVDGRLWTTALVVCRIRYQPLSFETKDLAVSRGLAFLQDNRRLLELAQDALPPYHFAAALPAESVREGLWKEATADIVETLGYNALQQRLQESAAAIEGDHDDGDSRAGESASAEASKLRNGGKATEVSFKDSTAFIRAAAERSQPDAAAVNRELLAIAQARQPSSPDGSSSIGSTGAQVTDASIAQQVTRELHHASMGFSPSPLQDEQGGPLQGGASAPNGAGAPSYDLKAGSEEVGRATELRSIESGTGQPETRNESLAHLPHMSSFVHMQHSLQARGGQRAAAINLSSSGAVSASLAERMRLRSEAALYQIGAIRQEALRARRSARLFVARSAALPTQDLRTEEDNEERLRKVEWRFARHVAGAIPFREGETVECFFRRPRMDAPPGLSFTDDWPLRRRYCTEAYREQMQERERVLRLQAASEYEMGESVPGGRRASSSAPLPTAGHAKDGRIPGIDGPVGNRKGHPATIVDVLHGGYLNVKFKDGPQEDLHRVPSSFVLRRGQHRRKFVPGRGSLEDMLLLKQHEALRRIWGVVPAEHGDDGAHEAGGPMRASYPKTTPRLESLDESAINQPAFASTSVYQGDGIGRRIPKYKRENRRLQKIHSDFAAKQEAGWDDTFVRVESEHARRAREAKTSAAETAKVEARLAASRNVPAERLSSSVGANPRSGGYATRRGSGAPPGRSRYRPLRLGEALSEIKLAESTVDALREESMARELGNDLELLSALYASEATLGRAGAEAVAKQQDVDLGELERRVESRLAYIQRKQHNSEDGTLVGEHRRVENDARHDETEEPSQRRGLGSLSPGGLQAVALGRSTGISSELVAATISTERLLVRLKGDLSSGERRWVGGGRLQDRHEAFALLTRTLAELRQAIVQLVRLARQWQGLPYEPSWHVPKTLDDVTNPQDDPSKSLRVSSSDSDHNEETPARSDADPSVPPFMWNGIVYLPALVKALDSLGSSISLKRWYGPEYPFHANPLSLPWSLKEHPSTPTAVQSWVRVAGTVEKRVQPELLMHHKAAVAERRKWRAAFAVVKGPIDMQALLAPVVDSVDIAIEKKQAALAEGLYEQTRFTELSEKHGHVTATEMLGLDGSSPSAGSEEKAERVPDESVAGVGRSSAFSKPELRKSKKRRGRRGSVSLVGMDGTPLEVEVAGTGTEELEGHVAGAGAAVYPPTVTTGPVSTPRTGGGRRCAWWWPAAGMSKAEVGEAMVACAGLIDAAMTGR